MMSIRVLCLTLACLAAVCVGQHGPPGSNPCTWGPSYWCKNGTNADRCNATEYCSKKAWIVTPAKPPQVSAGTLCTVCELVVSFVKPYVDNNATEKEAETEVEKLCAFLPNATAAECKSIVEKYFDLVWKLLQEQVDSDTICKTLKLCNSSMLSEVQAGPLCQLCQLIVPFLKPFVDNNSTEKEAQAALDQFCALLPGDYKTQCTDFVDKYFPEIWQEVQKDVDSGTICSALKLCSAPPPPAPPVLEVQAGPLCQLCQLIVPFLKPYVDNNSTEKEAQAALDKLCSILPGNYSTQCTDLVNQYLPLIWKLVQADVDSGTICSALKLCSAPPPPAPPVLEADPSNLCRACELLVPYVKKLVDQNVSESEAHEVLKRVCTMLKTDFEKECQQIMTEYFKRIWTEMRKDVDSDTICKAISACSSSPSPVQTKPAVKSGPLCLLCEFAFNKLLGIVNVNSTEEEIKKALEDVCKVFPSSERDKCTSLVDEFSDEIVKLVLDGGGAKAICTLLTLCLGDEVSGKASVKAGVLCPICEFVMKELEGLLTKNSTEAEIEAALEKVCSLLPSTLGTECDALVKQYGPAIVQLILKDFTPAQICTEISLCSSAQLPTAVHGSIECAICELVMKELESLLGNNSTEAEIEAALEKVCSLLPSTLGTECDALVKQYGPAIVQLILKDFTPAQICTEISLCSSAQLPTAVHGSIECAICELVMKELESLLGNNSTEAEIEAALEKVCSLLPSALGTECDALVKQYGPAIVQLILKDFTPAQICTEIQLCSSAQLPTAVHGSIECAICELVMKELESLLGNNSTEAEIEAALEKVCSLLPSALGTECDALVKQYGPAIVQLILKDFTPAQICTEIKLCSSAQLPTAVHGSIECAICELVMKELESLLGNNSTEAEIEAALEKVCSFLPSALGTECDALVKQYGPAIVQLILKDFTPAQICTEIKLCSSAQLPTAVHGGVECAVCELVMKELESLLGNNSTEAEIEAALEKVCSLLPSILGSECDALVKQYGPEIIKAIVSGASPSTVCTLISLCSSAQLPTAVHGGVLCPICEFVMKELYTLLGDNKTEAAVVNALKKVCGVLPATISKECEVFVETYGPAIINLIEQEVTPDQICTTLGLCSSNAVAEHSPKEIGSQLECDVCTFVLKIGEAQLANNATEDVVLDEMDKVCAILPEAAAKAACDSMLKQYGKVIIKDLLVKFSPEVVCTALKLCPGKTDLRHV